MLKRPEGRAPCAKPRFATAWSRIGQDVETVGLFAVCRRANFHTVNATPEILEARQRRLELARQAFKEFYMQCFWSYREDAQIDEEDLPWVIRELRHYGGAKGYQAVAEICR
jgi:hypothetical protein